MAVTDASYSTAQVSAALCHSGDELHCLKKSQLALGFVCALLELFSPFNCVLLELIVFQRQSGEGDDRDPKKGLESPRDCRCVEAASSLHQSLHYIWCFTQKHTPKDY